MEVADVFALTKADRPDAARLAREVRDAVGLRPVEPGGWVPAVVPVAVGAAAPVAELGAGAGLDALMAALDAHDAHRRAGPGVARRAARARFEVLVRAEARLRRAAARAPGAEAAGVAASAPGPLEGDVDAAAAALLRAAADGDGW
jgi:putative protein kinase ArgK-like GTPase of G3E family